MSMHKELAGRRYQYEADVRNQRGTMVCGCCGKPIVEGAYRWRQKYDGAFVTHHRACTESDPGWAKHDLDSLSPPDGVGLRLETTAEERGRIRDHAFMTDREGTHLHAGVRRLLRDHDTLLAALAAEKARADEAQSGYLRVHRETAEHFTARAEAEARCDTLAGALAGVIGKGQEAMEQLLWGDLPDTSTVNFTAPLGALRRARAALATIPAKPETQP